MSSSMFVPVMSLIIPYYKTPLNHPIEIKQLACALLLYIFGYCVHLKIPYDYQLI